MVALASGAAEDARSHYWTDGLPCVCGVCVCVVCVCVCVFACVRARGEDLCACVCLCVRPCAREDVCVHVRVCSRRCEACAESLRAEKLCKTHTLYITLYHQWHKNRYN